MTDAYQDDLLISLLQDAARMLCLRIAHDDGSSVTCTLQVGERRLQQARALKECPDQNSLAYFQFLLDEAGAMPVSRNPDNYMPPIIQRDHNECITAAWRANRDDKGFVLLQRCPDTEIFMLRHYETGSVITDPQKLLPPPQISPQTA